MKNNKLKIFIFSIVTVIAIMAIASGATYAYFQWTTAENQRTNLDITISTGGIEMIISPETITYTDLLPTSDCAYGEEGYYAKGGITTVTVKNKTGTRARPLLKLKVKVVGKTGATISSSVLKYIKYTVNTVDDSVDTDYLYPNEYCFMGDSGDFSQVSGNGEWTELPTSSFLESTFIANKKAPGETETITTKRFLVSVWLDSGYTPMTVGNVAQDPLQGATIYITWSENSKIEQIS